MSKNTLISYHPGEYISDALEAMNMSQQEFAARSGISVKNLSTLINGKSNITFEVAEKLAAFFHNGVDFWTNLQNRYESYLIQERKEQERKDDWNIVRYFDKAFLKNVCEIDPDNGDRQAVISRLTDLFMVSSLQYLKNEDMFAFYKTNITKPASEKETILRNAWISLAMKKANGQSCASYDPDKLKALLPELKKMTRMDLKDGTPLLSEKFGAVGIKFIELPYLKNSNVRGVTKWIANENCILIAVNDCGKAVDKIWFTIFHELGHALKNHKRHMTISTDNDDGYEETQANRFAEDQLIDPDHFASFIRRNRFGWEDIKYFAETEEIAEAIVIGRLEKEGLIPYGSYNRYQNRYHIQEKE